MEMLLTLLLAGVSQKTTEQPFACLLSPHTSFYTAPRKLQALISGVEVYSCSEFSVPRSSEEEHKTNQNNHTDVWIYVDKIL